MSKEESSSKFKHGAIGAASTLAVLGLMASGGAISWKIHDAYDAKDSPAQTPPTSALAASTSPTTVADMAAQGKG